MEHNYPKELPEGTVKVVWDGDRNAPYYLAIDTVGKAIAQFCADGEQGWDTDPDLYWLGRTDWASLYPETVWEAPATRVPAVGDRVRVTVDGVLTDIPGRGVEFTVELWDADRSTLTIPKEWVTVIEPAFDPLAVPVRTFLQHVDTGVVYVRVATGSAVAFRPVEGEGGRAICPGDSDLAALRPITD